MPTATLLERQPQRIDVSRPAFSDIPQAHSRRVALLAVHHVKPDGEPLTAGTLISKAETAAAGTRLPSRSHLPPGGAEKYIQTVIRALLDAGAHVHVGYSGNSIYGALLEEYAPSQLTVEQTGWLDEALSGDRRMNLRTLRQRRRWLAASGADTVFAVQQAGGGAFATSLIAARSMGLRVVASLRQWPQPLPAKSGKRWFGLIPSPEIWRRRLIWRLRIPASCCHALIYNSRRVAGAYHQQYGFSPRIARLIHNGEWPHRPSADRWRARPLIIGSVGRVTHPKGADLLLDAFTILARRYPASRLTYFGEGPLIPALTARAGRRGLSDRVTFAGYHNDREKFYSNMDICVHVSRRESMSNSVIEAMARGIPCVVTDIGGLPETVIDGHCGIVIPPNDPTACAKAIGDLLGDQERYRQFSQAACRRVRRVFDIRRLMKTTVETILGIES